MSHMLPHGPELEALRQLLLGAVLGLALNAALWAAMAVYTLDVIDETKPGGELRRAVLWLRGKLG